MVAYSLNVSSGRRGRPARRPARSALHAIRSAHVRGTRPTPVQECRPEDEGEQRAGNRQDRDPSERTADVGEGGGSRRRVGQRYDGGGIEALPSEARKPDLDPGVGIVGATW